MQSLTIITDLLGSRVRVSGHPDAGQIRAIYQFDCGNLYAVVVLDSGKFTSVMVSQLELA